MRQMPEDRKGQGEDRDRPLLTMVDRAIAWLFPGWGMRRAEARIVTRSYEALDINRYRAKGTVTPLGPVEENRASRAGLINDARDLDKNNAFVHGVCNAIVDNVIGGGIQLEAKIKSGSGRFREMINERVEDEFREWSRSVDPAGKLSFEDLQRVVERELWVAGEVLVIRSIDPLKKYPLLLEVVESERLAPDDGWPTGKADDGNEIIQGIEFTPSGKIAAYHIYKTNPSDAPADLTAERIPAERVLHLYHQRRPGEIRGLSKFASVIKPFMSLGQYLDFELTKARISSAFAMMIKRAKGRGGFTLPSSGDSDDNKDSAQNDVGQVFGGMIIPGSANDSIEAVSSSIKSTAFVEFVTLVLRMIGSGLNVSYELLTRDFSKHNFSSIRQSFLEDRRHWEPRQDFISGRLCFAVWRWFVEAAGLAPVRLVSGTLSRSQEEMVGWIPNGWDWVNPLQEKQADVLGIANYLQNLKKLSRRHGFDIRDNVAAVSELKKLLEAEGLPLPVGIFGDMTDGIEDEKIESTEKNPEASEGRPKIVQSK